MTLDEINALPETEAIETFTRCCAANAWAQAMSAARPFADAEAMMLAAETAADTLDDAGWLEAFAAHPLIGDVELLRERYAKAGDRANAEQGQVLSADDAVIERLAAQNKAYHARHGFIFIVCATGRSASEMLADLEARLPRSTGEELVTAAGEQRKITRIRLKDLIQQKTS